MIFRVATNNCSHTPYNAVHTVNIVHSTHTHHRDQTMSHVVAHKRPKAMENY